MPLARCRRWRLWLRFMMRRCGQQISEWRVAERQQKLLASYSKPMLKLLLYFQVFHPQCCAADDAECQAAAAQHPRPLMRIFTSRNGVTPPDCPTKLSGPASPVGLTHSLACCHNTTGSKACGHDTTGSKACGHDMTGRRPVAMTQLAARPVAMTRLAARPVAMT